MKLTLGDTRAILDECRKRGLLRNQAAYVLATAYHETAHTMKPVREMGGEKYLKGKKYYPYVGMGYVQLTWLTNYQKASNKLGVDFVKNPRLLLKPEYAGPILVVGMVEGWFTTKKLSDYITATKSDFVGARKIINGTDRAKLIADHAKEYDALLKEVGYDEAPVKERAGILKRGSTGDYVKELQAHLNAIGYGPLTVDGNFSKATEDAVIALQKELGLEPDGWAGPRTLAAIGKALKEKEVAPKLDQAKEDVKDAKAEAKVAEKTVPPTATKEVKEKTNLWSWLLGLFGVGGGGASALAGAEWQTVLAIGGVAIVALIVLFLMRRQIIAAFHDINSEARG